MKKIFILLILALVFAVTAGDTTVVNQTISKSDPPNIQELVITPGIAIEDSTSATFSFYKLQYYAKDKMYTGFQLYAGLIRDTSATTGSSAIAYQITMKKETSAILAANWVTFDTLAATGTTNFVDLSSKAGKYISFKIHNYNAIFDTLTNVSVGFKKAAE